MVRCPIYTPEILILKRSLDRDPFCASGDEIAVHLAYPKEFDDAAATFVTEKFQNAPQGMISAAPATAPPAAPPAPGASGGAIALQLGSPDLPQVSPAPSGTFPLASPAPMAMPVRRLLANSTQAASNTTGSQVRARAVVAPWSNAMIKFLRSGNAKAASVDEAHAAAVPAASVPWENANARVERATSSTIR